MKNDFRNIATNKSEHIRTLIQDGLFILMTAGVPLEGLSNRRLEKMCLCFLALGGITPTNSWGKIQSLSDSRILTSRKIIEFINENYEEKISLSSYDDIRRKDLVLLVQMGFVVKSAKNPQADTNDGTRGYAIEKTFAEALKKHGSSKWITSIEAFKINNQEYLKAYYVTREKEKLQVTLDEGLTISLDDGAHNQIQKAVIESFLPIYGYNAKVLYVGDTSEKQMHQYTEQMIELGLNLEDRGMLPDIIAFSESKQWIYIIEAVHTSNPLNPERCIELQNTLLKNCNFGVVYVTAFLNRREFAKWLTQIAWETEVWLADTPEHLIHFNGDRFMGPHK